MKLSGLLLFVFLTFLSIVVLGDEFDEEVFYDDFRLIDHMDESQALSYYSDFKYILLIAHRNSCTDLISEFKRVETPLRKLQEEKVVKTFFIDPEPQDDRLQVRKLMSKLRVEVQVLLDETEMVSFEYGLKEAGDFVVIASGNLRPIFRGNLFVEDCRANIVNGFQLKDCQPSFVSEVVRKLRRLFSKDSQCQLKIEQTPNLSYAKDVAPLITKHCYRCHYDSTFGSFRGYEQLTGWAQMIKQVIRTQRMPLHGRDSYYGGFWGDTNYKELKPVIEWVNQGAPRGTGRDPLKELPDSLEPFLNKLYFYDREKDTENKTFLPPMAKSFINSYSYFVDRKPDLVIRQKEAHHLPATGVLEYQYVELAGPFEKELMVRAIDIKINRRVVHHANLFVIDKPLKKHIEKLVAEGNWYTKDEMLMIPRNEITLAHYFDEHGEVLIQEEVNLLTSKKFVDFPMLFPEGTGVKIPKGSYLVLEYHYVTTGREEVNQAQVEFYLHANFKGIKERKRIGFYRRKLEIPPHKKDMKVVSKFKLKKDISILSFKPHFHYRGKSVKFIANYPDGKSEVLLSIPFYKFKWQPHNILKNPKFIPRGTELVSEVVYDNSKEFFQNPDPSVWVRIGGQTYTDEMHFPRFSYVEGQL